MENYRYISEPKKPLFSVGKAFLALIIILFNFWSFDTFAGWSEDGKTLTGVRDCTVGVGFDINSYRNRQQFGVFQFENKNYQYFQTHVYDGKTFNYYGCEITEPEPEPKPNVIETCDYGSSLEEQVPQVTGNWTQGLYEINGVSYQYRIETTTNIKYACDILHRYDVICWTGNSAAAAQFDINSIKDYPRHLVGNQLAYQGCLYDAVLTDDFDNKWATECYNATFYRTDTPADQVGTVDFTPYACEVKTCPSGQSLDEQGICQVDVFQCPDGKYFDNGQCLNDDGTYYLAVKHDNSIGNLNGQILTLSEILAGVSRNNVDGQVVHWDTCRSGSSSTKAPCPDWDSYTIVHIVGILGGSVYDGYDIHPQNVCSDGSYVSQGVTCPVTQKTCPNGSVINPQNQNCSTQICPDGSEIPFEYSCSTGEPDPTTPTTSSGIIEQDHIALKEFLNAGLSPTKEDLGGNFVGFYEVEYPNGFDDVWAKHKEIFNDSELKVYTDKWTQNVNGNLSLTDLYTMCFDMSPIYDWGCKSVTIDSRVFPFIRILLIFSSLILARKITLGG